MFLRGQLLSDSTRRASIPRSPVLPLSMIPVSRRSLDLPRAILPSAFSPIANAVFPGRFSRFTFSRVIIRECAALEAACPSIRVHKYGYPRATRFVGQRQRAFLKSQIFSLPRTSMTPRRHWVHGISFADVFVNEPVNRQTSVWVVALVYFAPDPMIYRARFRSFALMTAGRTRSRNRSLSLPCRHVDNQPRRRRIHHNIRRFLPGSNLQRAEIIYIHIFPVICTINLRIFARAAPNAVRITLGIHWELNSWRIVLVLQRFDRRYG